MATRNRTPLYRKYRDALRSVRIPTVSSSYANGGPSSSVEMAAASLLKNPSYAPLSTEDTTNSSSSAHTVIGLPPAWVDLSEEITVNIQNAKKKMVELSKVHERALMPSFGDGKEEHHAIEELTLDITNLLKRSEKRLMKLASNVPSEDSSVRKNVQRSLASDLQNLSMEFRKRQNNYLKRLRQLKEGQDGSPDFGIDLNATRTASHEYGEDEFEDVGFNDHQMSQLKKSEEFTREREKEISQVVESVNELAQIMKDLSILVIDQGTIIDRIDYNIQNVASTVEEGYKQLQKAERTQKKGGMVMCATVLVIMCFVMLVLLVLKEIIF
ncbi:Syntaxin [Rhynchospora pubera]|uniref:Syntaxin n=1 Tax=Rhynchospora pubera TaxID=906938 RepID=A0AAV8GH37_9POAL|nr:Syntaxin [Rhynchospora pubera]